MRASARGTRWGFSLRASAAQVASSSGSRCGSARGRRRPGVKDGLACRTTRLATTAPQAPFARTRHRVPCDAPARSTSAPTASALIGRGSGTGHGERERARRPSRVVRRASSIATQPAGCPRAMAHREPAGRRLRTPSAPPCPAPLPSARFPDAPPAKSVVRPGFSSERTAIPRPAAHVTEPCRKRLAGATSGNPLQCALRSRPDRRCLRSASFEGRGKSGLHRAGCRVTPGRNSRGLAAKAKARNRATETSRLRSHGGG